MGNQVVVHVVELLIKVLIGSDVFHRIEAEVLRWADKKITGAQKREGILDELEVLGLTGAEWLFRVTIDLVIGKIAGFDTSVQPTPEDFAKAKAEHFGTL